VVAAFAADGVVRMEVIAAFPHLDEFSIWLCTTSDEQRDSLGILNPGLDRVRSILMDAGFTDELLTNLATTAQSQETVDRDYEGSWFYALR
jgi:hypothetical protein